MYKELSIIIQKLERQEAKEVSEKEVPNWEPMATNDIKGRDRQLIERTVSPFNEIEERLHWLSQVTKKKMAESSKNSKTKQLFWNSVKY